MKTRTSIGITHLIASAGVLASVHALAADVPSAGTTPTASIAVATRSLEQAEAFLANGHVVKAKNLLTTLTSEPGLSDAERRKAFTLLNVANGRLRSLAPTEVTLQNAEAALETGELLLAERHAKAVADAPKATNEQSSRARDVLAQIEAHRKALSSEAPAIIARAEGALKAGRVDEARSLLQHVSSSGVRLAAADQAALDRAQDALVDAMDQARVLGASSARAGMMGEEQPGVVKKRDPGQPPAPPPQPAEAPKEEAKEQPKEEPKAPASEAQPAPAPAAPSSDELIRRARRFDAEALLREADLAFNERRLNDAVTKYGRLMTDYRGELTDAEATQVQNRIAEARVQMGARGGEKDILGGVGQERDWIRQKTIAEFNNDMARAQAALTSGDWSGARNLAAHAGLVIGQGKAYLSETEAETFMAQQKDFLASVDKQQEASRIAETETRAATNAQRESERRQAAEADRGRRINEAIARVRALQSELKYDEALQVCDQILFLDPINPTGLVLKEVLEDARSYRQAIASQREAGLTAAGLAAENAEGLIAPPRLMNYPSDWPAVSQRRGSPLAYVESEENRRVLAMLESKRIPVAFKDNSFADVVGFLQTVTQLNVDADWQSLEEIGIEREKPVTLQLTNVPVKTVLDRVMQKVSDDPANGAAWAINEGVLQIASKKQIDRNKSMQVYDIRDLLIDVPNYTNAPEFDLQAALQERGRGGGGAQPPIRDQGGRGQNRDQRTLEERTDELIKIITTQVDPTGWQENGGEVGFIQRFQGNLIITNTPANHRAIHGLLSRLREVRAMQINIETRFLLVSQDWFEQIGIDLDVYLNAKSNTVRTARTTRPDVRASDFIDFTSNRTAGSPAGVQRDIPGRTASQTLGPLAPVRVANGSPWSVIGAPQDSLGISERLTGGDFAGGILGNAPALGIAGQFLDDIQVDFLIKATQADRRTTTLTAPRLTLMNGQTSFIAVGTQTAYVSDLQPVVSDSAVGFDPTIGVVPDGVTLKVEGTVSADRRYVTLNVETGVQKLEGFGQVRITAVAGGQLQNSADTGSFIQTPTVTATLISTTVTVPDQGTILMGGQRLITEQQVESGVPVLSKLPILNRLFSNRIEVKEEQMLLILMKPTIIIQSEEEERNFPGLSESIRTGFGG